MAGPTRLELATSGVTGRRSNQLNYDPVRFNTPDPAQYYNAFSPLCLTPTHFTIVSLSIPQTTKLKSERLLWAGFRERHIYAINSTRVDRQDLVGGTGLEPVTPGVESRCSTTELTAPAHLVTSSLITSS